MKKKFKYIFPLLFCLFLTVFFFWKFFFKGFIPIPADITAGMYYPWLDYKWGYPVGVPVKNPILTDAVSQFWIWRGLAVEALRKGEMLFWNSYAAAGSPLTPLFHSALFSPFNLFYFFFSTQNAMSFVIITQLFLALVFSYLFLKELGLKTVSSLVGAVSFACGGFMVVWLTWGTVSGVGMWLPAVLWGFEKMIKTEKFRYWLFQILAFSFSLQNAHLQTFFYLGIFWILFSLFRILSVQNEKKRKKLLIVFVTIPISVFFINAFSILPAIEALKYSIRGIENYLSGRDFGFLPFSNLIKFLAPDFFGNHTTGNYWGELNYQEFPAYFGLVPLVLALIAIVKGRNKKVVRFFFLTFFIFLGFALKYPFGWLIYRFNAPFLSKAGASRVLYLVDFCGAVLAAFGIEEFLKIYKQRFFRRVLYFGWLPILGVGLVCLGVFFWFRSSPDYQSYENLQLWNVNLKVGLRNLVFPTAILALTSLVFFLKTLRLKKLDKILPLLLLGLTITELFRFGFKYTPFVPKKLFFPRTPVLEFLDKQKGVFRIERERGPLLPPNMWIPYGLESLSSYDPVLPRNYAYFIQDLTGRKPSRYLEMKGEEIDFKLYNLLNVKYILALKYENTGKISPHGEPLLKGKKQFSPIFEDGSVVVLENKDVFPRAFWVTKDDFERIRKNNDFLNLSRAEKIGAIDFISYSSQKIEMKTDIPVDAFVIISNVRFPSWRILLDDREVKITESRFPFWVVSVPKGSHRLLFKYEPKWFKIGLTISLASAFLMSYLYFIFLRKKNVVMVDRKGCQKD